MKLLRAASTISVLATAGVLAGAPPAVAAVPELSGPSVMVLDEQGVLDSGEVAVAVTEALTTPGVRIAVLTVEHDSLSTFSYEDSLEGYLERAPRVGVSTEHGIVDDLLVVAVSPESHAYGVLAGDDVAGFSTSVELNAREAMAVAAAEGDWDAAVVDGTEAALESIENDRAAASAPPAPAPEEEPSPDTIIVRTIGALLALTVLGCVIFVVVERVKRHRDRPSLKARRREIDELAPLLLTRWRAIESDAQSAGADLIEAEAARTCRWLEKIATSHPDGSKGERVSRRATLTDLAEGDVITRADMHEATLKYLLRRDGWEIEWARFSGRVLGDPLRAAEDSLTEFTRHVGRATARRAAAAVAEARDALAAAHAKAYDTVHYLRDAEDDLRRAATTLREQVQEIATGHGEELHAAGLADPSPGVRQPYSFVSVALKSGHRPW